MTTTTTTTSRPSQQTQPTQTHHHRGRVIVWLVIAVVAVAAAVTVIALRAGSHRATQVNGQNPPGVGSVPAGQSGSRAGGRHVPKTSRATSTTVNPGAHTTVRTPGAAQRLQARYGTDADS